MENPKESRESTVSGGEEHRDSDTGASENVQAVSPVVPPAASEADQSEEEASALLVRITGKRPDKEVPVGDRLYRLVAIKKVVRDFKNAEVSLREFVKRLAKVDLVLEYGFPKEESISKDKLHRWSKATSDEELLDQRYFGNGRICTLNEVTQIVTVQIMRESFKIKPKAVLRRLGQRAKSRPDFGIKLPEIGALKLFMKRMAEEKIPQILTAALAGTIYKRFGIRIAHPWEYSNEMWQTDSAESRIRVWQNREIIRPHVIGVVDCFSSLVVAAEMFPHEPHAEESLETMMKAILPKAHPFYNYGGLVDAVSFDQHGQFHSSRFTTPLEQLGIETCPVPVGQSPHNGRVERSFRTFRENFESDFPQFLKRRGRFVGEQTIRYTGDFGLLRKEFLEWVDDWNFSQVSPLDGLTAIARWHAGIPAGRDFFPEDITKLVRAHFVMHESVKVTGNCFVHSKKTGLDYVSGALAGKAGRFIDLHISIWTKAAR